AMACPCETRTSTCRSFATISSGLYRFLAITVLLDVKRHTSSRTTSMGADHPLLGIRAENDRLLAELLRLDASALHFIVEGLTADAVTCANSRTANAS